MTLISSVGARVNIIFFECSFKVGADWTFAFATSMGVNELESAGEPRGKTQFVKCIAFTY